MEFKKEPIIILKYDPINGLSCSDGKVDSIVDSFYAIVERDKYLKTNFGNLVVIKKFVANAINHGINPDSIVLLTINSKGEEEEFKI